MRRRRHHRKSKTISKLGLLFIVLILSLASISVSYAHWEDELQIEAEMTTTTWDSCIKIRKILDKGCPDPILCHDKYYLTIEVMNNGTSDLTDVNVTDEIGVKAKPIPGTTTASPGTTFSWDTYDPGVINTLTWDIGDLDADETVTLSVCLRVTMSCPCNEFIPAEVISPLDGSTYTTIRVHANGTTETVEYDVVHDESSRVIKFETPSDEDGLGDGDEIATDTFVINVTGGTDLVQVETKAGKGQQGYQYSVLEVGETVLDDNGFNITLVSITDIGGGVEQYIFTVTSTSQTDHGLSHISFDFGKICEIIINYGAKVTAKALWCDLEKTTDSLSLYIHKFYQKKPKPAKWITVYSPTTFPISTPWAEDCCTICCCD